MRLSILNLKFSPNLGDGIIAECLEHSIGRVPQVTQVDSCDLAGRTRYGQGLNRSRQPVRALISRLPNSLRSRVTSLALIMLISSKLRWFYRSKLRNTHFVLIGGGQLISDEDMNFCRKISSALSTVAKPDTAIGLHGVGVANHFSPKGLSLFQKAFAKRLNLVKVRDRESVERWHANFGTPAAEKVWDPGFLVSDLYAAPDIAERRRPLIGIGITNPDTLALHHDGCSPAIPRGEYIDFFAKLIKKSHQHGRDVELFTNGAFDDQQFAEQFLAHYHQTAPDSHHQVSVAERPTTPKELSVTIARYDGLIAHRLHANIIAFSYGISHVGLGWNSKMEGCFSEIGRSKYLLSADELSDADRAIELLNEAMMDPIGSDQIAAIKEQIHQQTTATVEKLEQVILKHSESSGLRGASRQVMLESKTI
jgi:polysaccharide pyruvyl transferase WcaK-like protein